jgi:hypothetical protein
MYVREIFRADYHRPNASNLFFAFHYLSPFIITALGTSLMGRFGFQALGADARTNWLQKVMRPALAAA